MSSGEGGRRRGFDRIRPPEDRLLSRPEGRLQPGEADPDGRAALFSSTSRPASTPGGVAVHCSRCGETSPVDAVTALRSALPLFLVAPWKDHPIFAICPAGRHRAWLRPVGPDDGG